MVGAHLYNQYSVCQLCGKLYLEYNTLDEVLKIINAYFGYLFSHFVEIISIFVWCEPWIHFY